MSISALQGWHPGEASIQRQLGYAAAVSSRWAAVENQLREQHQKFHTSNLPFIPLTTTDDDGRPWAGIAAGSTGQVGFVESPSLKTLVFRAKLWEGDPILETLKKLESFQSSGENTKEEERYLTAGLGIEFSTRRRNKFAGRIERVKAITEQDYVFEVEINEALGNCPKYINVRQLDPYPCTKPLIACESLHLAPKEELPDEVVDMITSADTVFIASLYRSDPATAAKYPSHAGMNSRGGLPGFIRVKPSDRRTIVLPDYSGNRFMSSLGNIESSGLAGLTIVSFTTGDIVYLTGKAKNHIGPSALEIMSRHASITVFQTTGFTFVRNALPVRQRSGSEVERSPYSPKIKYLIEEAEADTGGSNGHKAVLETAMQLSDDLAIFRFNVLSKDGAPPLKVRPGQALALDFMNWVGPPEYRHMADSAPGSINDDRVRTWTVSSAHEDMDVTWFELTMRKMKGGIVTGALFNVLEKSRSNRWGSPVQIEENIEVDIVGVTGDFTLPKMEVNMLLIAGGIGITPFLAMLGALTARKDSARGDVVLALSTREPGIMLNLIKTALGNVPSTISVQLNLFTSRSTEFGPVKFNQENVHISIYEGRIGPGYWKTITKDQDVFICGPNSFGDAAMDGLRAAGVQHERIQREGFY
ncbi:hypothetical protein BJX96DRAFT_58390 [Aspergillus floccosus]